MKSCFAKSVFFSTIWLSQCFDPKSKSLNDVGDPLILTEFIKNGKIEEGRVAAEVHHESMKGVKSYSGFFTVDEAFNSNLFFWFFPSTFNYEEDPLVIYLPGGPGASMLMVIFCGAGPFDPKSDCEMNLSETTWTKNHSVIFVDNPVGTGYSFTDDGGYAKNETIIGERLYSLLDQFYQIFPELRKNSLFVTGVSYAGKYIPALSYTIFRNNKDSKDKINLKGLLIADGWTDPINQFVCAEYLYQIGLVDLNGKMEIQTLENRIIQYLKNQQWAMSQNTYENDYIKLFKNLTGFESNANFQFTHLEYKCRNYSITYVQSHEIRKAIHVGNLTYTGSSKIVYETLLEDMNQSVAPWLLELLSYYPILTYNGQLDINVPYPATVNYLRKLNFSASEEYKTAKRHIWRVGNDIAGYVKQAGNLTEIMVRNAGHAVLMDQSHWCTDLMVKFTHGIPFY